MSNKKENKPKIRFPEFTDDWRHGQLKDFASFMTGNGLSRNDITDKGEQECILYGHLYTDYGMIADKVFFKTNTKINSPVYSEYGDVLIPASDTTPTGLARATSIEKKGVLLGGGINIVRPNKMVDGSCLSLAINSNKKELLRLIKGTTVRHLNNSDIQNIYIFLPSTLSEQDKIKTLFKILDKNIFINQHKLEILKNIKKGFLQKLFPKKDEINPELRFPGFNDDWEQHTLLECANFRRGSFPQPYGESKWYGGEEAMPFVQVADVSDNLKLVDTTKQTISKLAQPFSVFVPKDSVIVTLQGSIGRVALTQYDAFLDRTILYFEKYNKKIDKYFWAYIIQSKFESEALKAPGGTIKTITKEALSNFLVNIPCYEEQLKIGHFFKILDSNISFYKSNFEILQNIKKSLLQQMFV